MINMLTMAAVLLAAAVSPAHSVDEFNWMAGTWVAQTEKGWVEERWSDARGGTMLGTNRSGSGGTTAGFEFMRIAEGEDGVIQFWASPGGAQASAFPLVSAGANEAVFENPAHDYPTRIEYRRDGGKLIASISGPDGANTKRWTFCPRAVNC